MTSKIQESSTQENIELVPEIKDVGEGDVESQKQKLCCPDLRVIFNYMIAESKKKISGLRIGIFTVFMVVTTIVMLESVISITPILFVKLGQTTAGAIDFQLSPQLSSMKDGNVNYYAVDPFTADPNNNYTNIPAAEPILGVPGALGVTMSFGGYNITPENDHVEITLPSGQTFELLKFEYYNSTLGGLPGFAGFTPRSLWPQVIIGANDKNATNVLLIIDSIQEMQIGLAPQFPPYIIGENEVMLSEGILEYFQIDVGQNITNYMDVSTPQVLATFQLMGLLAGKTPEEQAPFTTMLAAQGSSPVQTQWIVGASYESSDGKFPSAYGNVVITDCQYLLDMMINVGFKVIMPWKETDPVNYWLAFAFLTATRAELTATNTTLCEYGMLIDGLLADQASYYMGNYEEIQKVIMQKAAVVQNAMTLQANATISAPLMKEFKQVSIISEFLGSVLTVVIVFLAILSSQLLYSLMLSDVDQKTYEYGMLRALGFKEGHLMTLISFQSFMFSIPGVCCGLVVAVILNMIFRFMIYFFASNSMSFWLTSLAVIVGVIFGLVMPLIAIILPVKQALGKNLRNSLDLNHRQNNEKSVTSQRLEDMGLSLNQTIVGAMLLILGFVTYYCVPLTFFYQKMQWFFFIFDALLIMIILGMTFMSILIFEYVEKGFLWVTMQTCCRRDRRLEILVSKNLDGHRNRNSKTSIMFTLAMSFLIFAASGFQVISTMIASTVEVVFGSDIYVNSGTSYSTKVFLDQGPLDTFLQDQFNFDGAVASWGFGSTDMNNFQYQSGGSSYKLSWSDLSNFYQAIAPPIFSVPEYYLSVVNSDFYFPASIQPDVYAPKTSSGQPDAVYLLYSNQSMNLYPTNSTDPYNITTTSNAQSQAGQTNFTQEIQVILPAGMKPLMSQDAGEVATFCQETKSYFCQYKYRAKIRGYITKLPGFLFSGFKQFVLLNPQIVISEDQYAAIMSDFFQKNNQTYQEKWNNLTANYTFYNGVPKQTLFINLASNCTAQRREFIINGLRPFFKSEITLVIDKIAILDGLKTMNEAFTFFVGLIGFISLMLTFFLLMVATTSNIRDNIWEYGVLRSMGVTLAEGKRIFMYEAFIVIIAAGLIGLLIGIVVACLITAQFYMFLELPFVFDFPAWLTLMLGLTALITTYVAVVVPIQAVNKKQIAVVLKSGA